MQYVSKSFGLVRSIILFYFNKVVYFTFQASTEDVDTLPVAEQEQSKADTSINNDDDKQETLATDEEKEATDLDDKGNMGNWENVRYELPNREKRFIGRWKNRNWLNSGRDYFDNAGYGADVFPYTDQDESLDKRQGGRWALINKQLSRLGSSRNRIKKNMPDLVSDEYLFNVDDLEKRMGSRWRFIQNKLKDLGGRNKRDERDEKRFMGRWKNQNWLLNQGNQDSNIYDPIDKRNIGRWRNRNWILQQYRERKSLGKDDD